jgi:hypothetical protein
MDEATDRVQAIENKQQDKKRSPVATYRPQSYVLSKETSEGAMSFIAGLIPDGPLTKKQRAMWDKIDGFTFVAANMVDHVQDELRMAADERERAAKFRAGASEVKGAIYRARYMARAADAEAEADLHVARAKSLRLQAAVFRERVAKLRSQLRGTRLKKTARG